MRWFPDRKGMITGLAVAGFGFGAMGWVKLAGSWGGLIERMGLGGTFVLYGIVFAALIGLGAFWMRMPPKGWVPEGFVDSPAAKRRKGRENFTVPEMLRTPQFYLIFMTFAVSAGSGLMSIGLMKLYPMEALQAQGLSLAEASAVAGTAMAVFFSLANGVGRIAWGTLSDRLGRRRSIMIMAGSQALFLFAFTSMAGTPWLLYLGAALIGFRDANPATLQLGAAECRNRGFAGIARGHFDEAEAARAAGVAVEYHARRFDAAERRKRLSQFGVRRNECEIADVKVHC